MTDARYGAGDTGPGAPASGPSSFSATPTAAPGCSSASIPVAGSAAVPDPAPAPFGPVAAAVPGALASRSVPVPEPGAATEPPAPPPPPGRLSAGPAAPPPEYAAAAAEVFGDRLALAEAYAHLLMTEGVVRGLIGPREAPRIWERHLINCGVMSEMIPSGASVVDVGSGAGLPGIVLAVARPDLMITLVEPLARRTAFLSEAVTALGLDATVTVVRGRAEDLAGEPPVAADVVTARAVAPLDRLAGWCLPLAAVGGRLLALKGASAAEEVAEHRAAIARLGGSEPVIEVCGADVIEPPTTVVAVVRERDVVALRSKPSRKAVAGERGAGKPGGRDPGRRRTRRG